MDLLPEVTPVELRPTLSSFLPQVEVLGAAISLGQSSRGTSLGPSTLRRAGLLERLQSLGLLVKDRGDVMDPEPLTNGRLDRFSHPEAYAAAFDMVYRCLHLECSRMVSEAEFSLVIGGDHSVAIASIAAFIEHRPDLGVIWVDAHGDLNTPQTSPTGNLHGMPLAYLLGLVEPRSGPGFEWLKERLRPEKVVLIGVRDLDPGERQIIQDLRLRVFTADDIRERGIHEVMADAVNHLDPTQVCPLHLSFDVDAVDPRLAPATGLRVPGGLTTYDVRQMAEFLALTGRVVSADLVELNPSVVKRQSEVDATSAIFTLFMEQLFGSAADPHLVHL